MTVTCESWRTTWMMYPFVSADWLSEITQGDRSQTRQAVWEDDFGTLSETLERDTGQSLVHAAANGFVILLGSCRLQRLRQEEKAAATSRRFVST